MQKNKNDKQLNKTPDIPSFMDERAKRKKNDVNIAAKKRTKTLWGIMIFVFLILLCLIIRLFWLEIIQGAELKEAAYNQQTINRIISPKRGTIYDSTGKTLAISSRVDTVTINPDKVRYSNDKKVDSEFLAKALAEIFELEYEDVLEKVNSNSSVQTIARKVEQDKITKLKDWMSQNKISAGINIDEDYKRSYPYSTTASSILGFCGTDNQGLWGLENSLDETLTGTPGKIMTSANVAGQEIPDDNRLYIAAENGNDVVLSIDYNIQSIAEKYLKQAVIENGCQNGGNVIIMNPETGDILAMANYPDYDLNSPYTPNEWLAKGWDDLTSEEKTSKLYEMWRNKAASATYEPGSTFKLITAAIALEEGLADPDTEGQYYCNGYYNVDGVAVSCWATNPHGYLSLKDSLAKSCNPALMQLGLKIGVTRFYKYARAFGLFESTHSGLYGESSSIMHNENEIRKIELATMSFGQRFTITPLQLITAVSAIVNDGILVQPRIVKQTINTNTGVVTNNEVKQVRQVISKETSEKMCEMLRYVVTNGTGKNADVKGYSIGGKSGTSEPKYTSKSDGYVASFIGVAPTTDVKVVVLVTLYKPTGSMHQGGEIAAPVVNQIFKEILPLLGISSNNNEVSQSTSADTSSLVVDVRNKTVAEAEKVLKNAGFKVNSSINIDKESTLVSDQVPKPGVRLLKNSTIFLYSDEDSVRVSVSVPDLKGMTAAQAINAVRSKDLNIILEGSGSYVINQNYTSGSQVEKGTVITVTMQNELQGAH